MSNSSLWLSLAILSSSFWGSWHCAAMCGPVSVLMTQKKKAVAYHLGRGFSYSALGCMGGYLGSFFLKSDFLYLRYAAGILFAAILAIMGGRLLFQRKSFSFLKIPWLQNCFSAKTPGFFLGILSIFLPCGWLYTYVMASVASQSPIAGLTVMFLFWLGGLPALNTLSLFMKRSISLSHQRKQRIAGFVLIVASLYSLGNFYFLH